MNKLRVLLADDHETVREGLKMVVNAQADMEVVSEASDGAAAIRQAQAMRPDVIVMDVSMPTLNGLKATEALAVSCPMVKILTLTRHAEEGYLQQMMRAGASGYVLKQSRASELLRAIRAVASGSKYVDSSLSGHALGAANAHGRKAGQGRGLSTREVQVVRFIAAGYGNKDIAAQLGLSVKTVETHKSNALRKLGLGGRSDIVRYAITRGWLQDADAAGGDPPSAAADHREGTDARAAAPGRAG